MQITWFDDNSKRIEVHRVQKDYDYDTYSIEWTDDGEWRPPLSISKKDAQKLIEALQFLMNGGN